MNLLQFSKVFPDENSCRMFIKSKREENGIICKKCSCEKHYWIDSKNQWRCANCRTTLNLKAGTMMEKSHIPICTWLIVIHLMTSTKKAFSAFEMQRQLGFNRYEPVWYMMQKIRLAMGKRDKKYKLSGMIELDDAFFEVVNIPEVDELGNKKQPFGKQGHGSNKQKVLVMVESNPNDSQDKPYKKKRVMGFVKMVIMDDFKAPGITYEVTQSI